MLPSLALSHFEASLLFALFTSVLLGIITKNTDRERLHYAVYCFACFAGALFGLSWLMYLGHG
jgi:CHASE2 domain-containing sensor protein